MDFLASFWSVLYIKNLGKRKGVTEKRMTIKWWPTLFYLLPPTSTCMITTERKDGCKRKKEKERVASPKRRKEDEDVDVT